MRRLVATVAVLGLLPATAVGRDVDARRIPHRSARKRSAAHEEKPKSELDTDLGLPRGPDRDYDGVPDRLYDDDGEPRDDDPD